jgi:hypothetical protein
VEAARPPRLRWREKPPPPTDVGATEDADRHARLAVSEIDGSAGTDWYAPGNGVDRAALTLCRLRRARAGERGGTQHGDEAVRAALAEADPEALVWLASRAIAYLDVTGFPEAVEPWLTEREA